MSNDIPTYKHDTKIIILPRYVYVYSIVNSRFDYFNYESIYQLSKINGASSIDEIINQLINEFPDVSGPKIVEDLTELIDYLIGRGYVFFAHTSMFGQHTFTEFNSASIYRILHTDIELTRRCNQQCLYCYNSSTNGSELSASKWIETIDHLYIDGLRSIKITGGEPFLFRDIFEIIDSAADRFILTINTNGSLLNELICSNLSKHKNISIQVSIDSSSPEIHNKYRGEGTWELAFNAIQLLNKYKIKTIISTTLYNENLNEVLALKELAHKYFSKIVFEHVKAYGRASDIIDRLSDASSLAEDGCQVDFGKVYITCDGFVKPCNIPEDIRFTNHGIMIKLDDFLNQKFNDTKIVAELIKKTETNICSKTSKCLYFN